MATTAAAASGIVAVKPAVRMTPAVATVSAEVEVERASDAAVEELCALPADPSVEATAAGPGARRSVDLATTATAGRRGLLRRDPTHAVRRLPVSP
jgi:hypothetical protein